MRIVLILLLFIISIKENYAQTNIIGTVKDGKENFIDVFDVRLYKNDTIFVKGKLCKNGKININIPEKRDEKYKMLIHSLGYEDRTINVHPQDSIINIGTILLEERNKELEAITVKAQWTNIKMKGEEIIVNVSKTPLSKVGTYEDIMRRIPGIIVSNRGEVSIMGKPRVLVHLNGRELQDLSILNVLQSSRIKSISIDRNPDVSYAASYDAIINIHTLPNTKDELAISPSDFFSVGRKLSNVSSVVLNGQFKRLSVLSDFAYSSNALRQNDSEDKEVWNEAQVLQTTRYVDLEQHIKSMKWGSILNYDIKKGICIGISYRGSKEKTNMDKFQNFISLGNVIPTNTNNNNDRYTHIPSIYCRFTSKNKSLSWTADLYKSRLKNSQDIKENGNEVTNYNFSDKYSVWGSKIDFAHKLSYFIYSLGTRVSKISDNNWYSFDKVNDTSIQKNYIFSSYINLKKNINKISLKAGLRYEWEKRTYLKTDDKSHSVDGHFFPNFSCSYYGKIDLGLSYSKRIYRPSYNQIIQKKTYIDRLSYSIGNPLLKATIVDLLTLSFQKKRFMASLSYEYYTDKKAQIAELDGENHVSFSYGNIPHSNRLKINSMYSYSFNTFNGSSTLLLSTSKMSFNGVNYSSYKNIGAYFKTTLERPMWKESSIMLSFWYLNPQYSDTYRMKENYNISLYISQFLLKKSLHLKLSFEDILHSQKTNNWVQRMAQSQIIMSTNADTRILNFTIQYNWGNNKKRLAASSAISEDINRL